MNTQVAKLIILTGILLAAAGTVLYFFHDKLHWIGHLPGDISIERKNFRFYFPLTTMLIASVLLTLLFRIAGKLFH